MSNNRMKRTLEFDLTDAPMLVHAFRIAACTARLCGHRGAEKKFDAYLKTVQEHVPAAARRFEEEAWAEMGAALAESESFDVSLAPPPWRDNLYYGGCIVVTIGEQRFRSRDTDHKPGTPAVEEVFRALAELARMDCAGTFDAKTPPKRWWEEPAPAPAADS